MHPVPVLGLLMWVIWVRVLGLWQFRNSGSPKVQEVCVSQKFANFGKLPN
ncbi:hypothetical protein CEB3_c18170 [Peptococcaceae bacterium CEB3]|nr:hypothetical protein CEB3_c18170 [Peptococcaceae bacterium CEB3]